MEPGNTITYSLSVPDALVSGLSFADSYAYLDDWVLAALGDMGIKAWYQPLNDIATDAGKIAGAAQKRVVGHDGAVLHHVTMAYDIDADKMLDVLRIGKEKLSDKGTRSAKKRVDPLRRQTGLSRDAVIGRMVESFRSRYGLTYGSITSAELARGRAGRHQIQQCGVDSTRAVTKRVMLRETGKPGVGLSLRATTLPTPRQAGPLRRSFPATRAPSAPSRRARLLAGNERCPWPVMLMESTAERDVFPDGARMDAPVDEGESDMLETVGLTAAEGDVYRLLLDAESASAEEISGCSGLSAPAVQRVLLALAAKGLAYAVEESPGWFAAIPPEIALVPRLQRHAEALEQARAVVLNLVETYRRSARSWGAGETIEIISGAAALRQRLRQLQDGSRHEMLWFCKAESVAMPAGSNQEEYDALARGVLYRVLYEQAYFDPPGSVDNVVRGVRAGETARAVPRLPLRIAIADRSVAVLPLGSSSAPGNPRDVRAALVRDSSLLEALIDLFEHYWEVGAPLRVTEEGQIGGAGPTDPAVPATEDRHLLSLMVAGMTDVAIAGQLRVSKRTVQRRIQGLMSLAGVATRMQLGWHAARRNWL